MHLSVELVPTIQNSNIYYWTNTSKELIYFYASLIMLFLRFGSQQGKHFNLAGKSDIEHLAHSWIFSPWKLIDLRWMNKMWNPQLNVLYISWGKCVELY